MTCEHCTRAAEIHALKARLGIEDEFSDEFDGIEGDHVEIEVEYEGETIEVDEGILPFCQALWGRGIGTLVSCQGGPVTSTTNEKYIEWRNFFINDDRNATVAIPRESLVPLLSLLGGIPEWLEVNVYNTQNIHEMMTDRAFLGFPPEKIDHLLLRIRSCE